MGPPAPPPPSDAARQGCPHSWHSARASATRPATMYGKCVESDADWQVVAAASHRPRYGSSQLIFVWGRVATTCMLGNRTSPSSLIGLWLHRCNWPVASCAGAMALQLPSENKSSLAPARMRRHRRDRMRSSSATFSACRGRRCRPGASGSNSLTCQSGHPQGVSHLHRRWSIIAQQRHWRPSFAHEQRSSQTSETHSI